MREDDHAAPVDFIGTINLQFPIEVLTIRIAQRLGFSLEKFRSARTIDEAFTYLRGCIEAAGSFPVEVFRGFALADTIAPMIVINGQDARPAWSFTALHELTHLWLGQTGISGTDTESQIERYCNDVAGELLLPANEIRLLAKDLPPRDFEKCAQEISAFAEARRLSRGMVAYKLLRNSLITRTFWAQLNQYFTDQWLRQKDREAEKNRGAEGGPSYYVVRRHRVGPALLGLVRRSLDEGIITLRRARSALTASCSFSSMRTC